MNQVNQTIADAPSMYKLILKYVLRNKNHTLVLVWNREYRD